MILAEMGEKSWMDKQTLSALIQSGRLKEAMTLAKHLCAQTPDDASLWMMLASAQAASGALNDVVQSCDRVIALQPGDASAHSNRGVALYSLRRLDEAEQAFRTALSYAPSLVSAGNNLGMILKDLGRNAEAIQVFEKLIAENASATAVQRASLYGNLAYIQLHSDLFEAAERNCRIALQLDPACMSACNNLSQALKGRGLMQESVAQQRVAVTLDPGNTVLHSNLLLDMNYLMDLDAVECAREHRLWGERHAKPEDQATDYRNKRDPDKRLRVGYVSPDFRGHSVAFFIEPLLSAHARDRVEIFCYANLLKPDPMTNRLHKLADQWRNVWGMKDDRLSALIRDDGIDILVDLAGHTSGNRLGVFGRKPAPIQVTWLGYPNTTGLREMDYRLTDEWADPPGASDDLYTETLVRMPRGFLCYRPLDDSPEVSLPPAAGSGHITFGCFNNSAKINTAVLDIWGWILRDMPNARLLLKSRQLNGPALRERYLHEFTNRGIDPNRIDMLGRINSTVDHLALYGGVDIALDTFPYNGTTTTCEALWMGVPVIALAGDRHAGRVGVSLLHGIGLDELIADSPQEYRRVAVDLARNRERLIAYRSVLRARMREAPLMDAAGFAWNIEEAYRAMWRRWCGQATTGS